VRRTAVLQGLGIRIGLIDMPGATVRTSQGSRTLPAEFSVLADNLSPSADTALMVTARLLSRIQDCSRRIGARFVVMFVPDNESLYPPGARRSTRYRRASPVGDEHRGSARFQQICSRARVACVDPTARFVSAADSLAERGELLIFPEDGHWNEHGHRMAATVLTELVRKELKAQAPATSSMERRC
jgi:hypothetical protein